MEKKGLRTLAATVLMTVVAFVGHSQTFEQNLSKIGALYEGKKYEELYKLVHSTKAQNNLKDVKLYMEAEALRNINRKPEALGLYEKLLREYPFSESAVLSRMTHFVLLLENAEPSDLSRLEKAAGALKTAWQKGTAFYKLSCLEFADKKVRSRLAYRSLVEFNSERYFYQTAAASVELLTKIMSEPESYSFSKKEWLAIAVWVINENLTDAIFKNNSKRNLLEKNFGKTVFAILNAEYLNKQKNYEKSMEAFAKIIKDKGTDGTMVAWARMLRGNIKHFAGKHSEAATDYMAASTCRNFPLDPTAINYRLMRSSFECGRDAETMAYINQFLSVRFKGGVFPIHIYEMGLKCYDNKDYRRALPYFMILARNFPGNHRADDALGYAAICAGVNSKDGKAILDLLKKKYPNSFYIWWLSPSSRKDKLKIASKTLDRLSPATLSRIDAMNKLWGTKLSFLAKSEALKFTDKYKSNLSLFKAIIDLAQKHNDYQQIVSFGERLSRQISEADKPLSEMPRWAWEALYPLTYKKEVSKYGAKFGIDPMWIRSIMREESHFKADILSRSNAHGLMQVLPTTGKWIADKLGEKKFNKNKLWDPELNIRYGSWYLKYLSDLFKGDIFLATAAYNGGQGNIQRKVEAGPYKDLPVLERLDKVPLAETRDYYKKVMGSYWNYTRLY